jgi:hypothetical protein
MEKLYRVVMILSYLLGIVCLVVGTLMRFVGSVAAYLPAHSTRGLLLFAGTLFLCALASAAMARAAEG